MTKLDRLRRLLVEIDDIESAAWLLEWDQEVSLPEGGVEARARQLATLRRLAHEKFVGPALSRLLDALRPWAETLDHDSQEAGLVRATLRKHERLAGLPAGYVARLAEQRSRTVAAWAKAKPRSDFAAVRPHLEQMLELSREYAAYYPGYEHIADPLIARYEHGLKAAHLRDLFARLRAHLVPLVEAVTSQPAPDDSCLSRGYPADRQKALFERMVSEIGYDLRRGRQDVSSHPFTTKFSRTDVRFTVRFRQDDLGEALFGFLHEGGHALYEQGTDPAFEGTPAGEGTSSGVHESQSRLWENVVGRSRGFWTHYYPVLQQAFPEQLRSVPQESFYRAINKVQRSLIRTEADELTYNLHVMIRFDLELELLEGKLAVGDLPEAWRERYRADLGIVPRVERDGVLQDIHWFSGFVGGMFQGYTLGNILSAQFYEAALQAHPEIPAEIEQGRFATLLSWLQQAIYRHGAAYTAAELIERVTGSGLSIEPYVRYLRQKYGELYALPVA